MKTKEEKKGWVAKTEKKNREENKGEQKTSGRKNREDKGIERRWLHLVDRGSNG